jgi:hypothetical protein
MGKASPQNDKSNVPVQQTAEQRRLLQRLEKLVEHSRPGLLWHHELGQLVNAWKQKLAKKDRSWLGKLAKDLKIGPSRLRRSMNFANHCTREEVEKLEAKGLPWGLVQVVASSGKRKAELRLLEKAEHHGWNVAELRYMIAKPHRGGRKLRPPTDAVLGLRQLEVLSSRWLKFFDEVWKSGDKPLGDRVKQQAESAQKQTKVKAMVKRALEQVKQLETKAKQMRTELERLEA